jgi:hypothetical protein
MIKAEYFAIHELVPPATYKARGEKAWQLIDPKLIFLIDELRETFGSATINNYEWGGDRQWSGLRTKDSPYYSAYSQHTFGRAVDMLFKEHTADEVRQAIVKAPDKWLGICPSITLEDGVSWLHIDVRNSYNCITLFNP